jgi:iron complex transport system ATP-binding protein
MRTIARLQPAITGEVIIAGKPLSRYSRNELAGMLSIVSTEPIGVSHLTVRQLVSFGRFPYTNWIGKLTAEDNALVEEAMQQTGITSLENKRLHEISDGERQRAMIARTLAQDTGLILLDEPTAFLDMPNKYEAIRLLHHLTRTKQKTILFSTHDLNIAMQEADKLWLIVDGDLHEGAPEDLVLNHQFARVFEGTTLHFDDRKGEFNISRKDTQTITLAGEGKSFFWTKKALERLGFIVRKEENGNHADVSVSQGNSVVWTVCMQGRQECFSSIYDLSTFLQLLSKKFG